LAELGDLAAQAAEIVFGGVRAPDCFLPGGLQGLELL
jgi:hypothetical protein